MKTAYQTSCADQPELMVQSDRGVQLGPTVKWDRGVQPEQMGQWDRGVQPELMVQSDRGVLPGQMVPLGREDFKVSKACGDQRAPTVSEVSKA